jgi:hypothetical protein
MKYRRTRVRNRNVEHNEVEEERIMRILVTIQCWNLFRDAQDILALHLCGSFHDVVTNLDCITSKGRMTGEQKLVKYLKGSHRCLIGLCLVICIFWMLVKSSIVTVICPIVYYVSFVLTEEHELWLKENKIFRKYLNAMWSWRRHSWEFRMSYKNELHVSDSCSVVTTMNRWAETERRDPVDITPVSYSGGSWLKSRPGNRLCWLRVFVGCPADGYRNGTSDQNTTVSFHILSNSLRVNHPTILCNIASASDSVVK